MKSFLLLLNLSLSGCALVHGAFGFPTTDGAIHCGQQNGIEVWVDGKVSSTTLPMSCPDAIVTVKQAHDIGAERGLWPATQEWHYRVEFINAYDLRKLDNLGSSNSAGYTLTFWAHDSAVVYQSDYLNGVGGPEPLPSCMIMMHEMIHMTEGGNAGHCHWTTKYAHAFKGFKWAGAQGWDDVCEHLQCSGGPETCTFDSYFQQSSP